MEYAYELKEDFDDDLMCPRCRETIKDGEVYRCPRCGTYLFNEDFLLYRKDLYVD